MITEIKKLESTSLKLAKEIIENGGLVAFGTETVYGLGANAYNKDACRHIFEVKGRPMDNPLIVHVESVNKINDVAYCDDAMLEKLSDVFPAALTVVLKKKECIPFEVSAGLATVGVRIPRLKEAREFLKHVGLPIAAPSANTSTRPSPTCARHVYDDFNGKIPLILDMGDSDVGLESTVLDLTGKTPTILRLGGETYEKLTSIFGKVDIANSLCHDSDKPTAPGMKYKHYAPKVPVVLFNYNEQEAAKERYRELTDNGFTPVILALDNNFPQFDNCNLSSLGKDEVSASHLLFSRLRQLENLYTHIITFKLPALGLGRTFNNRIEKASITDNNS